MLSGLENRNTSGAGNGDRIARLLCDLAIWPFSINSARKLEIRDDLMWKHFRLV